MVPQNAQRGFMMVLLATVFGAFFLVHAQTSASDYQHARVLSVREIRHASFPISRYPTTPQHTILAIQVGDQTYCAAYETPVLDAVSDLVALAGNTVDVAVNGKKLLFILPSGRRCRANVVKFSQC